MSTKSSAAESAGYVDAEKVVAALRKHPAVRDVAVRREIQPAGAELAVGYIVAASDDEASVQISKDADAAQIAKWTKLFSVQNFSRASDAARADAPAEKYKPDFALAGWKSSYTGKLFPEAEMAEWVDATVEQMLSVEPKRVLEVGAGLGLLLFRVAPTTEEYWATDICDGVVEFLQKHVRADRDLDHVKIIHAQASEMGHLPEAYFDLIVLSSVVQYFPSPHYFLDVLKNAARALRPGGTIFCGDIRNAAMLEAFHLSVLLAISPAADKVPSLKNNLRRRVEGDMELAAAPQFFHAVRNLIPQISDVVIEPRRGKAHNEFNCFRYNVKLRVGDEASTSQTVATEDWTANGWTLDRLRGAAAHDPDLSLTITNIPNARSAKFAAAVEQLRQAPDDMTIADFRAQLDRLNLAGVDPQAVWDLAASRECEVHISWSNADPAGSYDATIAPKGVARAAERVPVSADKPDAWVRYCNDPVRRRRTSALTAQLDQFLKAELPNQPVPARLMVVDRLPAAEV